MELATGTLRHYLADALGSVTTLTDENGVVKTTYNYDPFGQVSVSGEASDNPFQYTGREKDGTGLYYYRARYYSPELQRFISEDPIGLKGGVNYYVYTNNSPVTFVDPLGLIVDDTTIGNPPTDRWPPPLPGNLCETICYLTLANDYYWCWVAWSNNHLNGIDPERARQSYSGCTRESYDKYKNCISKCKACPSE